MDKNTETVGRKPHIDTLQVKPGYFIAISPIEIRSPRAPRVSAKTFGILPAITIDDRRWWA